MDELHRRVVQAEDLFPVLFKKLKNVSSHIIPYFITSAIPARNSRLGNVLSVSTSAHTSLGLMERAYHIFPFRMIDPCLGRPTELSTWARKGCGHLYKSNAPHVGGKRQSR